MKHNAFSGVLAEAFNELCKLVQCCDLTVPQAPSACPFAPLMSELQAVMKPPLSQQLLLSYCHPKTYLVRVQLLCADHQLTLAAIEVTKVGQNLVLASIRLQVPGTGSPIHSQNISAGRKLNFVITQHMIFIKVHAKQMALFFFFLL